MKAQLIKELGTVDLDRVEATSGQITVFVPIKVVENDLSGMLDKLEADYRVNHPEASTKVNFTISVVYSFGGYENPEFELEVIVWDDADEDIAEYYEEIKVNLSPESAKEVKRIVWDGLGKTLFNL